jgi:DNA-binding transcriptional LysR family regulator
MRFDLTDLRLFLGIVEHGSLTRGAEAMNLALASASERISGMEAILGTPLFERSRRGVKTTAAGDVLGRHARLILFQMEQMRGELRFYGSGLKGRIRVFCNTAAVAGFLPEALCRFLAAHPDLSIDLDERPSADIVLAVAEGQADLGIAADIADLTALQTRFLAEDRLVVVTATNHRIASAQSVDFADVVDEPFVGVADAALETHLEMRASRLGRKLNRRIRLPRVEDIGRMIEAGVGLAILSESSARLLRRPSLAILPLAEPWAHRRLYLCARDFRTLTPQAKLLAEHLTAP